MTNINNQLNYTTYHLHSDYSLLDSCTQYESYVDYAIDLGQKSIAFTEHGNIFNWTEKKRYCDKKGIKYIHGVEVYVTEKLFHKRLSKKTSDIEDYKIRDNYHTILLAKNEDGVKEINSLVSLSSKKDHFYYKPRITIEEFLNISPNVIKISACLASPLARIEQRILSIDEILFSISEEIPNLENEIEKINNKARVTKKQEKIDEINYKISNLKILFEYYKSEKENLIDLLPRLLNHYDYYEIQYHNTEEQILYNRKLYELSKKYKKPLIAGTDTHSLNSYKAECRIILQKAKTGAIFGKKKTDTKADFSDNESEYDLCYKSYEELVECFKAQNSLDENVYLEAINNTNVMADSVEDFKLDTSIKYPLLYENDDEVLVEKTYKMFNEKVEQGVIPSHQVDKFKECIEEEFRVFRKVNMMGFILSMSEFCTWAKDNNHPIGTGRGSSCGSVVAYITNITDVNPITWRTIFSRFCNEDRVEIGD